MKLSNIASTIINLLMSIFKMNSKSGAGMGIGDGNDGHDFDSAKILSSKLDALSRSLLLEKMDCLQEGNQMKADMFNAALIATKTFSKDLEQFGKTKEISFESVTKKITDKITESLSSEASVNAFNDFRNRGEKPSDALKQFGERLSVLTSEVDFGPLTNKVNEVAIVVCEAVSDHYSQSPLTPRQKNGLDPVDEPEIENNLQKEKDIASEKSNSGSEHSM